MAMTSHLQEREFKKFVETAGGEPAVRIANSDGSALAAGGTSMTDDTAFTVGTSSVTPVGFLVDDTATDPVDEGDIGAARMSARREVYVQVRDAAGNERGLVVDANGAIPITAASLPSHAVTNAGTFAVQATLAAGATTIAKAEDAAHASGDVGVPLLAVRKATAANLSDTDGDYEPLQISAGRLWTSATIDAALPAGTNNIGDVDVLTVPADPFGANADAAATAGSTGSIQAKLRLITSQLDAIKTAVETLDNTVGGSELQVDVVGALPAGTNAIGKLAANSGVDIGDVDVLTAPLPTGGTMTAGTTSLTTTASTQVHAGTACKSVILQNDPDNTYDILVGTSGNEVFQLVPGQDITLPVSNVNQVYAKNVTSSTQTLNWISVT